MSNAEEKTDKEEFGKAFDEELLKRGNMIDSPDYKFAKSLTKSDYAITAIFCLIITVGLIWSLI